jgi:hypothetical protein
MIPDAVNSDEALALAHGLIGIVEGAFVVIGRVGLCVFWLAIVISGFHTEQLRPQISVAFGDMLGFPGEYEKIWQMCDIFSDS